MTSSKHVTGVSLVASGALEEGAQGRRKARGRGAEKRRGVGCCWKGVSLWGQQLGSRLGCKNRPSGLGTARARPQGRTLALAQVGNCGLGVSAGGRAPSPSLQGRLPVSQLILHTPLLSRGSAFPSTFEILEIQIFLWNPPRLK